MGRHALGHADCSPDAPCRIDRHALTIWPGLDRRALANCRHDLSRIARLVGRCTNLPEETIRALLSGVRVARDEPGHWFG